MPRETKAEREKREATPQPEAVQESAPEQQPTVHVLVERGEDGSIVVDVVATGDVRPTEIESLLKLALKRWEAKSGIG